MAIRNSREVLAGSKEGGSSAQQLGFECFLEDMVRLCLPWGFLQEGQVTNGVPTPAAGYSRGEFRQVEMFRVMVQGFVLQLQQADNGLRHYLAAREVPPHLRPTTT